MKLRKIVPVIVLCFCLAAVTVLATISTEVTRNNYSGDGGTTVFPYTFKIYAKTDLLVILSDADGNETVQTVDSQYTVSGLGEAAGGNVTMVTAPAATEKLTILRNRPLKQETDYIEGGPFLANTHEDALDELTMIAQQLQEQLNRTPHVKKSVTISNIEISEVTPGEYLRWNLAGDGIDSVPAVYDLGNFLQSGTGAVSRTASSKMGDVVSVADFGALGDDATDDTLAISRAISSLSGGGTVWFAPNKIYRVTDIQPASSITLQLNGSTLKFTGTTGTMIKNDSGALVEKFSMLDGKLRTTSTTDQGTALQVAHMNSCYFRNLDIQDFDIGIYFAAIDETGGGNYYNTFVNMYIINNDSGVVFFSEDGMTYKSTNATLFLNPRINNNDEYNVRAYGDDGNTEFHGSGNQFIGGEIGSGDALTKIMAWAVNSTHTGNGFFGTRFETAVANSMDLFGDNSSGHYLFKCDFVGTLTVNRSGDNQFDESYPYPYVYRVSGGGNVFGAQVLGDTYARFLFDFDGSDNPRLKMGGGAAAQDVNFYRNAANQWKTDDQIECVDGIATKVVADAVDDNDFTVDTNGLLAIDSSNGRFYFRYGGAWHYVTQTAGFEIPKEEVKNFKKGDIVIGRIDGFKTDGAAHAQYISFEEALRQYGLIK